MSEKMMDECRAQFEIWLTGDGNYPHLIHKNFGGSYLHEESAMKWDGWKTAWNIRATPASESAVGDVEPCVSLTEDELNRLPDYVRMVILNQANEIAALKLSKQNMVMLPRKLTDEMEIAFGEKWYSKKRCVDDCQVQDCFDAMIAAHGHLNTKEHK